MKRVQLWITIFVRSCWGCSGFWRRHVQASQKKQRLRLTDSRGKQPQSCWSRTGNAFKTAALQRNAVPILLGVIQSRGKPLSDSSVPATCYFVFTLSMERGKDFSFRRTSCSWEKNKENRFHSNTLFFCERLKIINFSPSPKRSRGCIVLCIKHMR